MQASRILFITTNNLATNPRLFKELELARLKSFGVTVILFSLGNWSEKIEAEMQARYSDVNFIKLSAGRDPFFLWLVSSLLEKAARYVTRVITFPVLVSWATGKRSYLISKQLRKMSGKFDWVVVHNPAAFYPATLFAKRHKIKLGIDVEDYHPGESNDKHLSASIKKMMANCLPKADYVSFASPLIKNEVESDLKFKGSNWFTVLNYFPGTEFPIPDSIISGPLKLVWFSQNINAGRGLENILPFIKAAGNKIELHLIGNLDAEFAKMHLKDSPNIFIHPPKSQKELHQSFVDYDIGLALDVAVDRNRELALTNKILAYLQSGLFIIASDTPAQKDFLIEFPENGALFDTKLKSFDRLLSEAISNVTTIRKNKLNRYYSVQEKCWENESMRILTFWKETAN